MSKKLYTEKTSEIRIDNLIIFIKGNNVYVNTSGKEKVFLNGIEVKDEEQEVTNQTNPSFKERIFHKVKEVMG